MIKIKYTKGDHIKVRDICPLMGLCNRTGIITGISLFRNNTLCVNYIDDETKESESIPVEWVTPIGD